MGTPGRCNLEFGMKWRVMLELVGPDGIVGVHEVGGRAAVAEYVVLSGFAPAYLAGRDWSPL